MGTKISFKDAFRQMHADLIGKDSFRGITLTYAWLANQFGHFSLGFFPTTIMIVATKMNPLKAAIIIWGTWTLFESYNLLGPLLFKKQSKSKNIYVPSDKEYIFKLSWSNLIFDTLTDIGFFGLGSFSAGSLLLKFYPSIAQVSILFHFIPFLLLVALILPIRYWFLTKMHLQYARFPIQFRLSQWHGAITEDDKAIVNKYTKLTTNDKGNHLLIFGGRKSNKSQLGIGIGAELSINHLCCSYYTGMKLYNLFSLSDNEIKATEHCEKWTWRKSSVLIIDDINPGNPISEDFISPERFLEIIQTPVASGYENQNSEELANKNVIWIMGNEKVENMLPPTNWIEMLINIGVAKDKITTVNLGNNFL